MGDFLNFLSKLFEKEKKTIVIKNQINGNNCSSNYNERKKHPKLNHGKQEKKTTRAKQQSTPIKHTASISSIRLYATGKKGKVYTNRIRKSLSHNFGIEVKLKNSNSQPQDVHLGHCIYDRHGNTLFKGNCDLKLHSHSTHTHNIYVDAQKFSQLKCGKYKSQFWLNNTRVQKTYFTIVKK